MKKVLKFGVFPLFIILVAVAIVNYEVLNIVTGFAAKSTCSCTFEGQRALNSIEEGDNDIMPVKYTSNTIDYDKKQVSSTLFGLKKRTAVFKEGVGCVLILEDNKPTINYKPNRKIVNTNLAYPYGDNPQKDTVFQDINYEALEKAVINVFDEDGMKFKRTRAVLVIYKDQIITEKYADGFNEESKFLGWSMTKSITSAVVGVLEKQGKVNVNQTNLFPEWKNDARSKITLNNLLQMNSGLEWVEDYNTISDVTKMLFLENNMANVQLNKSLIGKPNNSWNYSSGTTNLISKYIRNQFNSHQEYLDFWYAELIDKIGMSSLVIETDLVGNYIGSSYGWATARDWAKFGLLYLNEGNWNGEQILNKSWINYTKTPTNSSDEIYGAQFWLNAGGVYPNVPKDLYSCNGYQGQYVFIIPSKNLVVVRFGLAENPIFNVDEFLSDVIATIQ